MERFYPLRRAYAYPIVYKSHGCRILRRGCVFRFVRAFIDFHMFSELEVPDDWISLGISNIVMESLFRPIATLGANNRQWARRVIMNDHWIRWLVWSRDKPGWVTSWLP